MKRMMLAVLILCILGVPSALAASAGAYQPLPGAVLQLGQYEQDSKADNGQEAIEWIVLEVKDDRALLLSKQALDCLAFNDVKQNDSWEYSSIRSWLNGAFFQSAFSSYEQQAILLSPISNAANECNPEWNQVDSPVTEDRVFLLSYAEAMKYFPEQNDRKLTGTSYAREHGARFLGFTSLGIGETDWWLRSPGRVPSDAAYIDIYGAVGTKNSGTKVAIRPALWLDLSVNAEGFTGMRYQQAVSYSLFGNYATAAEIFESLGEYSDSAAQARENRYLQAQLTASRAEFDTAAAQFEALSGYKDSDALATKNRYLYARQLSSGGEYDAAIALFEALDGYEDSNAQCRAARYEKAKGYQEAGDYATAARLFGEVGQYEDSMARMKECFNKTNISMYYFHSDVVNTGVDNGYSIDKAKSIENGDKQFGWRLGRFFMSGFTRGTDDGTGNPLFIKNLGDSITLWFDLEQNIDALNGNPNLIIGEDTNGSDVYFNIPKTNFGRGTLIIQHKDYQNAKGDPVIYTDYLLAKGTTAADTKVVLREEGDYEVALNYELQDNDLTHILNRFDNYRVFFRFSIRNGNCMVYPFDVKTRAELQNTAVTENGFYLDLARSRYLKIDVKRSVIIQGQNGMVEDVRFSRPASDGEEYTAEGIYTISVKNPSTGESIEKTIFVGTNELLQEYIAHGFNQDRLK